MPKRTRGHDSWLLEKLTNPDRAAVYLSVALEDSPQMFLTALRNVAQARTMAGVARQAGITRESLYRATSGEGNPTLDTLDSVLNVLGMGLRVEPRSHAESKKAHSTSKPAIVTIGHRRRLPVGVTHGVHSAASQHSLSPVLETFFEGTTGVAKVHSTTAVFLGTNVVNVRSASGEFRLQQGSNEELWKTKQLQESQLGNQLTIGQQTTSWFGMPTIPTSSPAYGT